MPKLSEMNAVLEQAMFMQRQCRTTSLGTCRRGVGFDGVVVRDEDREPAG